MEKYIVKLTGSERECLLSFIANGRSAARKLTHARIVLEADEQGGEQKTDDEIAELLHISKKTVQRVRRECVEHGIASALERKNHIRYRPHKIHGEAEAHLVALCCSAPPEGRCRWTLSLLTEKFVSLEIVDPISRMTVARTLKKTN